jgi:hypothetical protein
MPIVSPTGHQSSPPRIYRTSPVWTVFGVLLGTPIALGGAAGAWLITAQGIAGHHWLAAIVLGIVIGAIAVLGAYCALSVLRARLLVFPDRIEIRGLVRTRVLTRDGIVGFRVDIKDAGFVLVPRDGTLRPEKIAATIKLDEAFFDDWPGDLPNLDENDVQQAQAEIASDGRLGATPEERLQALEKGRRLARPINIVALAASLWGFLYPRPYPLVIAILSFLPLLALGLVARAKGILRLDRYRNDPHPHVAAVIIFPPLALAVRSLTDFYVVYWTHALWLTIGVGAVMCYAAVRADPAVRARPGGLSAIVAFLLAYGYGAGLQANALLDRSATTTYVATISEKYVSRGRSTSYSLKLKPWALKQNGSTVTVLPNLFKALEPGDSVIFAVRQGAFGVPWYAVQSYRRRDP